MLTVDPPVATLTLSDVGEGDALLRRGDVELADALQRVRFERPEVGVVVMTGDTERVGGAIEDARAHSGLVVLVDDGRSALSLAEGSTVTGRGPASEAVLLGPLWREEFDGGFAYPNLRVEFDRAAGAASLTISGPPNHECFAPEPGPRRLRSRWWPLAVSRELDDVLLVLGRDHPDVQCLLLRTEGDPLAVASADVALTSGFEHDWFVREVVLSWKRTLKRLDLAGQTVIALVEPESCFVGTLLELALTADRICIVDGPASDEPATAVAELLLTGMNFGPLPLADGRTRLEARFSGRAGHVAALAGRVGDPIGAAAAVEWGLVTEAVAPTDWQAVVRRARR